MESITKTDKGSAVVTKDSFFVKNILGISVAMVCLEEGPKRWHVTDYVYAPDKDNDHSQISIDDFANEEEARKVFDFRKKSEDDRQKAAAESRRRAK